MKENRSIFFTLPMVAVVLALGGLAKAAVEKHKLFRSPGRTTYYVDSQKGDDKNDGTSPEKAWKTLDRVNTTVYAPGDKILFKAGTSYTGQLKPKGSGKSGSPISIDKFGQGPKPRIDGQGAVLDTLLLENVEYWQVSNLEITNLGSTRADWRTGVKVLADSCGTLHQIHLKNLYVHDVNGSLDKSKEGCGIFWQCKGKVPSRFNDLLIEDCHLVRTDRNGICGRSSFTDRSGNWFPSLNVVIRGNLIEDCGGDCIKPWGCKGCLVEYNIVNGGRQRCDDYAAGIWPWSSDDTIIQFNEVSHIKGAKDGQGFDSDYNCRNSLFQYNYSHDNDGGFMLICGPAVSSWSVGTIGTIIRYNISQNDKARTFHITGASVKNTCIYNNLIYVGPDLNIPLTLYSDWEGWPDNTRFYNNIFYADGTVRYSYATGRNPDGTYKDELGFWQKHKQYFLKQPLLRKSRKSPKRPQCRHNRPYAHKARKRRKWFCLARRLQATRQLAPASRQASPSPTTAAGTSGAICCLKTKAPTSA